MSNKEFINWFRNASPYINAHRGKTFVVLFPGECVEHEQFAHLIHDFALLSSLGIRLVLVHGSRPQIDAGLNAHGFSSRFHQGLRITEPQHLNAIHQAVGALRIKIEAALSTGLPNSPMHGSHIDAVSGNYVFATPRGVIDGIDLQHTGKVRRVDTQAIKNALSHGAVVVVSPVGYSLTGEVFNLSYHEVATRIAVAINADKVIAFAEQGGVIDDDGHLVRQLTVKDCEKYMRGLTDDKPSNLQLSLLACYNACQEGIARAHIISYAENGSLLEELFSRDGSGTMVYRDSYESLRQASIEDVGGILELLEPLERQGILVRRSRELLETEISRFRIIEKDGTIIACGALYPFENNMAELACLATRPEYRNQGRAALLLAHLEKLANSQGIDQLFVLTTQTAHWFIEQGFEPADTERLPSSKKKLYNYQRNSKVFIKTLN